MKRTSRMVDRAKQGMPAVAADPFSWAGLEEKREKLRRLASHLLVASAASKAAAETQAV